MSELDHIDIGTTTQAELGLSGMDFQANGLGTMNPDGSLQLRGDYGWTIMMDANGNPLGVIQMPSPGYDFNRDGLPPGATVVEKNPGQMTIIDQSGHEIGYINANPMNDGEFPDPWGGAQVVSVSGVVASDGYFALSVQPTAARGPTMAQRPSRILYPPTAPLRARDIKVS